MVVYISKSMIMRIKPYVGTSRIRRYRMVDMCKGKRKWACLVVFSGEPGSHITARSCWTRLSACKRLLIG
jgi:hypothetical protein